MTRGRTPRWRRRIELQRKRARHVIATGAGVSLLLGVVAEVVVAAHTPTDIAWLVRVAIMLPTVIFLAWWLLEPGHAPSAADMPDAVPEADILERMASLTTTFDAAAAPAARAGATQVSPATRDLLRRSVRTPAHGDRVGAQRAYGLPAATREHLDGTGQ
ncbi:MAG: hypothetical protein H7287_08625 [Thermoleophilia bacterium]|nr:hypothetical protein [Thermoleophilia bacterium]